jgi:glycosyltransferase involved in cell wall biosynthesis
VTIRHPSLPLISIVTPSFNQGRFIRQTIESVLTQDYPNIEYWIVDGGSNDDTLDILRGYECEPRLRWISEKDQGQSDAINKGLARCCGDIFNWLCSDDVILPGALRKVADAWVAHGTPAIIYGLARFVDENGKDLGYCPQQSTHLTLKDILTLRVQSYQPATFVPTEHLRQIGGIDASYHYVMDFDMWVKLAQRVPFVYVPHDVALYRLHASSKSLSRFASFIPELERVLDTAARKGLISARAAQAYTSLCSGNICLHPTTRHYSVGLRQLLAAVRLDYRVAPAAVDILLRSTLRLLMGEAIWNKVRSFRSKPG